MQRSILISGVKNLPEVLPGDDLAVLIIEALAREGFDLLQNDIVVITQKIVSKAEGRIIDLSSVVPSRQSIEFAEEWGKDARVIELALQESNRVVRMQDGILITENKNGFVCANSGIDASNVGKNGDFVILLPVDCDKSAMAIKRRIEELTDVQVAIVISDTFGRPWREGAINVAVGVAGMDPLVDYRGIEDTDGREMHSTTIATADELASAAELVMNKIDRIPVAIVRGYEFRFSTENSGVQPLLRDIDKDLFK
jgi:coenzyme F420-0:L-glutamate ligase/coenzyme F420-1:gamma-L-glutamate ligase